LGRKTVLSLYDGAGRRLYINEDERKALIRAAGNAAPQRRALALVLIHTGCRISEALALTPARIDVAGGAIIFRSLKKRSAKPVFRPVPVPSSLIRELVSTFAIDPHAPCERRLWQVTRGTGYGWIKDMMMEAKIPPGPHQSPKGLRHGFAVHALLCGVSLTQLQLWMGHADIAVTAIYTRATGPEERKIAQRMWRAPAFGRRGWGPLLAGWMRGLARRIARDD